ncbi:MAG: gliding motility-associated C-terminal domain-containing protein [Chitinophagales bacterium]
MKLFKITILSLVVLFTSNVMAVPPSWSINANAYQYNMSVTASAKFNCDISTNPNNMIGAFINNNLAGFANINGEMFAYVTVYSNVSGGETVTFKMYDAVNDTLLDSKYTTIFQENASIGNASTPFVQKSDYELMEITIDTDTIFEFNQTGDSVVMFRIENENNEFVVASFSFVNSPSGADNSYFTFTDSILIMAQNVDYLAKDFYNIHVQATNSRGCSIDMSLVISVKNTNTPPTGVSPNPTYFDENQFPGTLVTVLTADDLSPNDTHTFEITNDLANFPDNSFFSIVNDSLIADTNFNNDIQNQYNLQITVTDNLLGTYTDTFIVYINGLIEFTDFVDNPVNFNENQDSGLLVTQFVPVGILPIDTHTFSLSADTTNFPDNDAFTITTDSLLSNWNYDFETQSVYTLEIEVRDKFGTLYLDTFVVNINDIVEFTGFEENPVMIDENLGPEILVSSLTPIGFPLTKPLVYSLSSDTSNFPDNNFFWINSDSLVNKLNFDYEIQDAYELLIEVRDQFDTMYLDTFLVFINDIDEFEYFEEDPIYIDENLAIGTLVSELTPVGNLVDDDLTFILSTDTINFPDNNAFIINLDKLLSAEIYNYEDKDKYKILIEITNRFGTKYLDTLTVFINDLIEIDDLKANNVITPNDDGFNDFFVVPNIKLYENFEFVIYNENGNLIFRRSASSGYNNLWNGKTTSGAELAQGVYYYRLKDLKSDIEFKGEITLLKD